MTIAAFAGPEFVTYRGSRSALEAAGLAVPAMFPEGSKRRRCNLGQGVPQWRVRRCAGGVFEVTRWTI